MAWEFPLQAKRGFGGEEPSGTFSATFRAPWRRQPELPNPFAGSKAEIEVQHAGEKPEFLMVGAAAQPFPEAIRFGYPSVYVGGIRKSDGRLLAASLTIDPDLFKQGDLPVDMYSVMGVLIDVNLLEGDVRILGLLSGQLKLDEASTKHGEFVSGTLDAVIRPL